MKIKKEYCTECGRKLEYQGLKGAENFGRYSTAYDPNTGRRLYVGWVACPLYVKKGFLGLWYDNYKHDAHAIGKVQSNTLPTGD